MDFQLRTVLILLAIIITGGMVAMYAVIVNIITPYLSQMPHEANSYIGGHEVSLPQWVVNRDHVEQTIISHQGKHDVYLWWELPPADFPLDEAAIQFPTLARRFFIPDEDEIDDVLDALNNYELALFQNRGEYFMLHPWRDGWNDTTIPMAPWQFIDNRHWVRGINVREVSGSPGSHNLVVREFLNRNVSWEYIADPGCRSVVNFRIIQYSYDNGDIFFFISPDVPADDPVGIIISDAACA